jgi:hypothetical protein
MTHSPELKTPQSSPLVSTGNRDLLGWVLIMFSSVLLGIWAVRETIALRNGLLGVGTILSLVYCVRFFKNNPIHIPLKNWIPFILLGLMFCWVVVHYLFFSRFPDIQLHELISTWLRSGLAIILALGTGLALSKRPSAINCLWVGILVSFAYLFYQYIPEAIAAKSLFAIDYGYYIYRLKISGVLMGTILVVGLLGTIVDTIRRAKRKEVLSVGLLWLLGTLAAIYSFVFIFDTRNGVGLAVIIFAIVLLMVIGRVLGLLFLRRGGQGTLTLLALMICAAGVVGWLGGEHVKRNPGWSTMWEDTKTSIQVEKYPNWQNLAVMGYPQNATGEVVKGNSYERLAWAMAGFQILLPENPLGVGVLKKPFYIALKEKYPNSADSHTGTHSAWVDIALAFGYPGIFLFLASLISTTYLSSRTNSSFKSLVGLMSIGLILLYTVGEVSSQHSIEILCFLISLISALLLPTQGADINNEPAKARQGGD